jgi:hypothetical protein
MMKLPTAQEKSEQIFFTQPKAHMFKFAETNKMVTADPLWLITFFEQCQAANKAAGIHGKIAKGKKSRSSQKRIRQLIFLSCAAINQATGSIVAIGATIIEASDTIAMPDNPTTVIETIDTIIILFAMARTIRATSSIRRRMVASAITSRKRVTSPCTMTSPLCQAWTLCPGKGVALVQDLLLALILGLALAQAAGATTTIMCLMMIASRVHSHSAGTCTPPRGMTADVSIALTRAIPFLPPSLLQRQREVSAPTNR